MPRLSIIIPTLGNSEALENTLVSVLQNRPPRGEVVVVHNCVYEDPYDLKDEVRFVEAPGRSKLVDLINAGLVAASSELIHILPCGAVVDDGWTAPAMRHFADSRVSAVAPVVLDAADPARVLSAGCHWLSGESETAHESSRPLSDVGADGRWTGPDSAAAFYRRSALSDVGAFDATLSPRFAAIDLSLRLIHAGRRILLEPTSRVTIDPSLWDCDGPFRQSWQRERLFWRHERKHGWLPTMAAHGWLVVMETLKSSPRRRVVAHLAGRLVGACDRRGARLPALEPLPAGPVAPVGPPASVERRLDPGHAIPPSQSRAGLAQSRADKTTEVRSRVRR